MKQNGEFKIYLFILMFIVCCLSNCRLPEFGENGEEFASDVLNPKLDTLPTGFKDELRHKSDESEGLESYNFSLIDDGHE